MWKFLHFITYLTLIFISSLAQASDSVLIKCHPMEEIVHKEAVPDKFNTSNNLRRASTSLYVAQGEPIHIVGRVTDQNCVPVANAIVRIWHSNAYGSYQINKLPDKKNKDDKSFDKNFAGTGSAVTDNLGYYSFITILPNSAFTKVNNKYPPSYINFIIENRDFSPFETKMFFPDNIHKSLNKVPKSKQSLFIAKQADNLFIFNITLPGKHKYLKY